MVVRAVETSFGFSLKELAAARLAANEGRYLVAVVDGDVGRVAASPITGISFYDGPKRHCSLPEGTPVHNAAMFRDNTLDNAEERADDLNIIRLLARRGRQDGVMTPQLIRLLRDYQRNLVDGFDLLLKIRALLPDSYRADQYDVRRDQVKA